MQRGVRGEVPAPGVSAAGGTSTRETWENGPRTAHLATQDERRRNRAAHGGNAGGRALFFRPASLEIDAALITSDIRQLNINGALFLPRRKKATLSARTVRPTANMQVVAVGITFASSCA